MRLPFVGKGVLPAARLAAGRSIAANLSKRGAKRREANGGRSGTTPPPRVPVDRLGIPKEPPHVEKYTIPSTTEGAPWIAAGAMWFQSVLPVAALYAIRCPS